MFGVTNESLKNINLKLNHIISQTKDYLFKIYNSPDFYNLNEETRDIILETLMRLTGEVHDEKLSKLGI